MPSPRERAVRALIEEHGLHGALHALVEVCYGKAVEPAGRAHLNRKTENWRRMARQLSDLEAQAAHLDF